MDELPQADKTAAIADALLGDGDKAEARQLVSRMEALTAALKQRLDGLR
jgi:hypothetical protein